MVAALQHRGPDEWGTYLAPDVGLGHTRLSIVDLASGQQPMETGRFVIAYNGEVFNHVELRKELEKKGVSFRTHCDTEVVLRLFEEEGPSCFSKLNGQFAILIWDRKEKTLTAVRDRYGIRPLYVLTHENRLYFSSEMKSFDTIPGYLRQYAPSEVLEHALLWNTLGDSTVYQGIRSVESGTYEIYRQDSPHQKVRYYQVGQDVDPNGCSLSFEEAKEQFKDLLQDSVNLRLRSDVPVGAYLSGGIDSSVIAHLTKDNKKDDFLTFAVGFEDDEYDESYFQKLVADQIDSELDSIRVSHKDIEENFMEAVYHTERPIFRTAPVPLSLLSERVAQRGFKVVLTGEGADEILYGYDTFKELKILEQWKKEGEGTNAPELLRQLYPHLKHYADPEKFGMLRMYYEGHLSDFDNELCGLNIRVGNNKVLANFINKDHGVSFEKEHLLERLRPNLPDDFKNWSLLRKNSFLEVKTLLQGYLLSSQGDRMSMSNSIEGRYPFLDHRVVEAVFNYPDDFKLRGFSQKHILCEAFRGKVPTEILDRPKRPYMAPDLKAFYSNGVLTERARHFLSDEMISDYGMFDTRRIKRFLNKFEKGFPDDIGYRDNMIMVYLLSSQMAQYWARTPKETPLDHNLRAVSLSDYQHQASQTPLKAQHAK